MQSVFCRATENTSHTSTHDIATTAKPLQCASLECDETFSVALSWHPAINRANTTQITSIGVPRGGGFGPFQPLLCGLDILTLRSISHTIHGLICFKGGSFVVHTAQL